MTMGPPKKSHDGTRQERKAKKRKLEDAVPDLPGHQKPKEEVGKKTKKRKLNLKADKGHGVLSESRERREEKSEKRTRHKEAGEEGDVLTEIEVDDDVEDLSRKQKNKKGKESQKRESSEAEAAIVVKARPIEWINEAPKKSKKERKAERRAKEVETARSEPVEESKTTVEAKESNVNGHAASADGENSKKNNRNREKKRREGDTSTREGGAAVNGHGESRDQEKKDARFICFIGNLPFTATTESITKHFEAIKPISVRALTQKDNPTKSKGVAFLEFEGYDHMKTCLKMFHHSMFDDGLSAPRKINVELTAGGGGNTRGRKAKIQDKNQKLNEQRVRRMQEEAKIKLGKSSNAAAIDESAIHPSRRTRVPGV